MRLSTANFQLKLPGNKKIKMPFKVVNPLKDKLPIFKPDDKLKNYWDALMFMVVRPRRPFETRALSLTPRARSTANIDRRARSTRNRETAAVARD